MAVGGQARGRRGSKGAGGGQVLATRSGKAARLESRCLLPCRALVARCVLGLTWLSSKRRESWGETTPKGLPPSHPCPLWFPQKASMLPGLSPVLGPPAQEPHKGVKDRQKRGGMHGPCASLCSHTQLLPGKCGAGSKALL